MSRVPVGIQFFGQMVEMDIRLQELKKFLDEVDLFLSSAAEAVSTKEDLLESMDYAFADSLPEILYSSFIASVVSYLEREAQQFARVLAEASATPLTMTDLSGAWYERFRKFCEKLAALNLEITEQEWQDIRGVVEVRNCLLHAGGELQDFRGRQALQQFVVRRSLPSIEGDYLLASRALADVVLIVVKNFLELAYGSACAKYPS